MYDKAEKVVKNLSNIIFDLRAENESLYDTIEMYSARIDELRIEVSAREKVANEYKERIKKAVDYIKEHIRIDDEYPAYMEMLVEERDNLLNILNGENDKSKGE